MIEIVNTLSYYHNQIGNMNYYPLFRVRLWNKVYMRCMSLYCYGHIKYRKTSNIRHTIVGNKIVYHSDVVGASPVCAAPTTSSFSTWHLVSRDKPVRESFKCWDLVRLILETWRYVVGAPGAGAGRTGATGNEGPPGPIGPPGKYSPMVPREFHTIFYIFARAHLILRY